MDIQQETPLLAVTVQVDYPSFRQFSRMYLFKTPTRKRSVLVDLTLFVALFLLVGGWMVWRTGTWGALLPAAVFGLMDAFLASMYLWAPPRQYKRQTFPEMTYAFFPGHFSVTVSGGDASGIQYTAVREARETDLIFCLLLPGRAGYILPKKDIPPEARDRLHVLLRDTLGKRFS